MIGILLYDQEQSRALLFFFSFFQAEVCEGRVEQRPTKTKRRLRLADDKYVLALGVHAVCFQCRHRELYQVLRI